ncbi:hypothetical protein Hanom_Chr00s038262g01773251 [Helianthus anomalus]
MINSDRQITVEFRTKSSKDSQLTDPYLSRSYHEGFTIRKIFIFLILISKDSLWKILIFRDRSLSFGQLSFKRIPETKDNPYTPKDYSKDVNLSSCL